MSWSRIGDPRFRPYLFLAGTVALLALLDWDGGRFLSRATAFSTMQSFATLGPVALGLGLTMLIREFDLSVAGMFGLAGCIAVLTGVEQPWLGLVLAVLAGCGFGVAQGVIMTSLNVASVGVTLGGLLTAVGIAYVLTESQSLIYPNMELALGLNERIMGIFSARSIVAMGVFAVAIVVVGFTRLGRDMIATGSDRRAALISGVNVDKIVVGTFAFSGVDGGSGGLAAELQSGIGLSVGALRRAGAGGSCRHPRRCVALGRNRHAARHRGRRADACDHAVGAQRDRSSAVCPRYRDGNDPRHRRRARRLPSGASHTAASSSHNPATPMSASQRSAF